MERDREIASHRIRDNNETFMPYNFNGIESLFTPQCVYRLKHEKGKLKHRAKCDYTAAINGGLLLCIEKCNGNCDRFITHTHTRGQHDMKSN